MPTSTCFIIQPFDKGKFDKRFRDVFKPAIKDAGLEAYRVDQDPGSSIPIHDIERGIRDARVCLADITLDNPNVWFELGFAISANKPVVPVCSAERVATFPFDVQHRTIIQYSNESQSDFEELKKKITEKIKAVLDKQQTPQGMLDPQLAGTGEQRSRLSLTDKLALYDRRFVTYRAVMEFVSHICIHGGCDHSDEITFLQAASRNRFLFESDIQEYIELIYKQSVELNHLEKTIANSRNEGAADYRKLLAEKSGKIREWFGEQFKVAEQKFGEYISITER